jgi:hypothetical protein
MNTIVFTDHALSRIKERALSRSQIEETVRSPDKVSPGRQSNTIEHVKKYGEKRITVITGKTREGGILILSCWIDPPHYGTADHHKRNRYLAYQKASIWKRILMDLWSIVRGR